MLLALDATAGVAERKAPPIPVAAERVATTSPFMEALYVELAELAVRTIAVKPEFTDEDIARTEEDILVVDLAIPDDKAMKAELRVLAWPLKEAKLLPEDFNDKDNITTAPPTPVSLLGRDERPDTLERLLRPFAKEPREEPKPEGILEPFHFLTATAISPTGFTNEFRLAAPELILIIF